ncbi:MAG: hypothetical protein HYR96_12225 [Deltaproteobacteria bacterium]|nr:hypothetical protein [Deltaproteobacteria bacterium]
MKTISNIFQLFSILIIISLATPSWGLPKWSYDAGPDRETEMGRQLININADIPNFPGISQEIMGTQKFRAAFGPVLWRMRQAPNSMKILFIGQDATHIAEAAGRTATAGFGGRAQDLARYFGVNESAGFMNTYAFTIYGQYGGFGAPYVQSQGEDGEPEAAFGSYVDNDLWLMTQDPKSPITQWRNRYIDWVIRNNRDSLKLIVTFGGAARDAAGAFILSRGGTVYPRLSDKQAKNIRVPLTKLVYAGGNNEFPVPIDSTGKDLYTSLLGHEPDYARVDKKSGTSPDQEEAHHLLEVGLDEALKQMVFSDAGPLENGTVSAAQLGAYNLKVREEDGTYRAMSLNGLILSDESMIKNDILVIELPHPSALSRLSKDQASAKVKKALEVITPYLKQPGRSKWAIKADPGQINHFKKGEDYEYARTNIGPEFYDFGAPGVRMVAVSSASRMSKKPHVIIFGSRDKAQFDLKKIDAMADDRASEEIDATEMFTARPRGEESRFQFDPGPGETMAQIMKENLDLETIFETKDGKTWDDNGIDAFNMKSHPDVGDFGHYRGTFKNPKVVILADPSGYDDLITARALTGERGQYLNGLMRDLAIDDQYLVIKTVPFGMDGATDEEWETVLEQTEDYRREIFKELLKKKRPMLFIADGDHAGRAIDSLIRKKDSVVKIPRTGNYQKDMKTAGKEIAALEILGVAARDIHGERIDIPRTQLSYYARIWEGTSGDRVLNSSDAYAGQAFAEVAPLWAIDHDKTLELSDEEEGGVQALMKILKTGGFRLPGESVKDFLKRLGRSVSMLLPERFRWAPGYAA